MYLIQNKLLAVPFYKGIGICLMKLETYNSKLDVILGLPQFKRYVPQRKNEKHIIIKEEERIVKILKTLRDNGKISSKLFDKLKLIGSQPPCLYGNSPRG